MPNGRKEIKDEELVWEIYTPYDVTGTYILFETPEDLFQWLAEDYASLRGNSPHDPTGFLKTETTICVWPSKKAHQRWVARGSPEDEVVNVFELDKLCGFGIAGKGWPAHWLTEPAEEPAEETENEDEDD